MNFNWLDLKINEPVYIASEDAIYIRFNSTYGADKLNQLLDNKQTQILRAIGFITRYYGKQATPTFDLNQINYSLSKFEYYVDPRPSDCTRVQFLAAVRYSALNDLEDITEYSGNVQNENIIDLNTFRDRQKVIRKLEEVQRVVQNQKYSINYLDQKISLEAEISLLKNYYSTFQDVISQNNISEDKIKIGYSNNNKILYISDSNRDYLALIDKLNDRIFSLFSKSFLINYDDAITHLDLSWDDYLRKIFLGNFVIKKETNPVADIFSETLKELEGDTKSILEGTLKQLIDPNLRRNCNPSSNNSFANNFVKTAEQVNIEQRAISDIDFKKKIIDENIDRENYVGDPVLRDLSTAKIDGSIEDVYDAILNRIPIQYLIDRSIKCVTGDINQPDVPEICVPSLGTMAVQFPDSLSVPNLFGSISTALRRAFFFAVSETIKTSLKQLIKVIEKCSEDKDLSSLAEDPSKFQEAIFANPVDNELVDEMFNLFSTKELCEIFSGNITQEQYELILCIVINRYSNLEKFVDNKNAAERYFKAIGEAANIRGCSNIFEPPTVFNPEVCVDDSQRQTRELLLNNKGLTSDQIQNQLDMLAERRQSQLDMFRGIAESGGFSDEDLDRIVKNGTQEDNEVISFGDSTTIEANLGGLITSLQSYISDQNQLKYIEADEISDIIEDSLAVNIQTGNFTSNSGDDYFDLIVGSNPSKAFTYNIGDKLEETVTINDNPIKTIDIRDNAFYTDKTRREKFNELVSQDADIGVFNNIDSDLFNDFPTQEVNYATNTYYNQILKDLMQRMKTLISNSTQNVDYFNISTRLENDFSDEVTRKFWGGNEEVVSATVQDKSQRSDNKMQNSIKAALGFGATRAAALEFMAKLFPVYNIASSSITDVLVEIVKTDLSKRYKFTDEFLALLEDGKYSKDNTFKTILEDQTKFLLNNVINNILTAESSFSLENIIAGAFEPKRLTYEPTKTEIFIRSYYFSINSVTGDLEKTDVRRFDGARQNNWVTELVFKQVSANNNLNPLSDELEDINRALFDDEIVLYTVKSGDPSAPLGSITYDHLDRVEKLLDVGAAEFFDFVYPTEVLFNLLLLQIYLANETSNLSVTYEIINRLHENIDRLNDSPLNEIV